MNLELRAEGMVIYPNGKKRLLVVPYTHLAQTRTEDTYAIMALPEDQRLKAYRKRYGDLSDLRKWVQTMEELGMKLIWTMV